ASKPRQRTIRHCPGSRSGPSPRRVGAGELPQAARVPARRRRPPRGSGTRRGCAPRFRGGAGPPADRRAVRAGRHLAGARLRLQRLPPVPDARPGRAPPPHRQRAGARGPGGAARREPPAAGRHPHLRLRRPHHARGDVHRRRALHPRQHGVAAHRGGAAGPLVVAGARVDGGAADAGAQRQHRLRRQPL
ncbi:MAG: hypothetical protein AVDCRST_MAG89-2067, partial [uncultured Gemmatimonadetes bacterium]